MNNTCVLTVSTMCSRFTELKEYRVRRIVVGAFHGIEVGCEAKPLISKACRAHDKFGTPGTSTW